MMQAVMKTVKEVKPEETWPLRQKILRPQQPVATMNFAGDFEPTSKHFAAFADDVLVGVASIYQEGLPEDLKPGWRLRGMATQSEVRGEGYGAMLLRECLKTAQAMGGSYLWCNARVVAEHFYTRHGFKVISDVFEIPEIGPHIIMRCDF